MLEDYKAALNPPAATPSPPGSGDPLQPPPKIKAAQIRMLMLEIKDAAAATDRLAVKRFVWSHRLSIANAFYRRLVREDVVAELVRLFQAQTTDRLDERHAALSDDG